MQIIFPINISFGDCDPAGIVFYPNAFRWMDAGFHALLRQSGGHAALCRQLGAVGMGVVDTSAKFHHPMRDGDQLELVVRLTEWSRRSFTLEYQGEVEGKRVFAGREVRCLFIRADNDIVAGETAPLRALVKEQHD
ncbi:acyl-CoA thioesterase [Thalassovita taeanensis]|uniref:4-hydroxybenzoyl-CoA thioesterase n=1 Tax=Thalassovita taeanensis TaxID=657014 RepID=A0A1H9IY94_9RHOB|nr:acyl-CoA thioesterase [Thalassovita taeanensis]SEQ79560.1 4-hydroxybenzoyl-CoA thioesterase [Thalassovita taeanensis]